MNGFLLVAAGGAIGASARHLVNIGMARLLGFGFPSGTLTANILGSFLMGVLIETLALKYSASNDFRLFAATGILGGFTTFSAFSLDVALMTERGQTGLAAVYVAASVAISIAALFAGLALTRWALT
jgi:CrcB protein